LWRRVNSLIDSVQAPVFGSFKQALLGNIDVNCIGSIEKIVFDKQSCIGSIEKIIFDKNIDTCKLANVVCGRLYIILLEKR